MLKFVPNFFIYIKNVFENISNILFPPVCGICGKLDSNWICEKCQKRILKFEKYQQISGKENILQFLNYKDCGKKEIYFDDFLYCFEYKGMIRKLLLKYKFSGASYLSNMFANILLSSKKVSNIFKIYDIIIPVPMNKIKKMKRGYNQTELIVNIIEKKLDYTYQKNKFENYVLKIRKTKTQSTLNSKDREKNIKNAFKVINPTNLINKNVILFDDICTTGSTVNEISKILKKVGVNKIFVLVIAKD